MTNIQHVDSIVKETEELFSAFYGAENSNTAYIFTADHGMSNLGNHGDGGTPIFSVYLSMISVIQTLITLVRRLLRGVRGYEVHYQLHSRQLRGVCHCKDTMYPRQISRL